MPKITTAQLAKLLSTARTQPATITSVTTPRMRKSGNPYIARGVVRRTVRNGFIGPNYANVVNAQRLRESRDRGRRKSFPLFHPRRLWRGRGVHFEGSNHLVQHTETGRLYLVFLPVRMIADRFEYADTNRKIPDARIARWLTAAAARSPSAHQGTAKPIEWRVFALESIQQIQFGGRSYSIAAPRPVLLPFNPKPRGSTRWQKPKPKPSAAGRKARKQTRRR